MSVTECVSRCYLLSIVVHPFFHCEPHPLLSIQTSETNTWQERVHVERALLAADIWISNRGASGQVTQTLEHNHTAQCLAHSTH